MAGNILGELLYKISADTTGLNNGINASIGKVQGFGNKMAGMIPTALIIAAATAAGRAVLKLGTDAVETESKFGVVFSNVGEQAALAVAELNKSYGMAKLTAQEMLSATGDILSGFGFNQETALSFSTNIAKISTDIASFKNVQGGAQAVSEAVTKAMLGEREMLKTLGIAILEEDVKTQMLKESKAGLVYESERQAKAAATYNLILEKSANAQGDFARTATSNANQIRVFQETLKDAGATIGKDLQPAITTILQALNNSLPKMLKVIDPLVPIFNKLGGAIGSVINLVGELIEPLMPFLDIASAIVGAALDASKAVIDATTAVVKTTNDWNRAIDEGAKNTLATFKETQTYNENAGMAAQTIADGLARANNEGRDLGQEIRLLAEQSGYSVEQVEQYAMQLGFATEEMKKQADLKDAEIKKMLIQNHIQTVYINAGKQINQAAIDSANAVAEAQASALVGADKTYAEFITKLEQEKATREGLHALNLVDNSDAQKKLELQEQIKSIEEGIRQVLADGGKVTAKGIVEKTKELEVLKEQLATYERMGRGKARVESEETLTWWNEYKQGIQDAAAEVFTLTDAMNILGKAGNDALKAIGENLVSGGDMWTALKDIAVNAIADILDGLGNQLAIMVVTESLKMNFIGAGLALAGSIAAYAGAAYVRSLASSPESSAAGDQATPPATNTADTARNYNTSSADRSPIIIQMDDGSKLSAFINRQIKQGKIVTA